MGRHLDKFMKKRKTIWKANKTGGNKRSNEYHFNSVGKQTIPNQANFVRKDRGDSLTYFGVPYITEMQTPKLDKFTSERQTTRKASQSKEVDSLDGKHLDRLAIIEPSQDMYHDQRSGKCDCNEGPNDLKFTGYFQGQANLDTGKVTGYYYNTHARVVFENALSTQAPNDKKKNIC